MRVVKLYKSLDEITSNGWGKTVTLTLETKPKDLQGCMFHRGWGQGSMMLQIVLKFLLLGCGFATPSFQLCPEQGVQLLGLLLPASIGQHTASRNGLTDIHWQARDQGGLVAANFQFETVCRWSLRWLLGWRCPHRRLPLMRPLGNPKGNRHQ